MAFKFFINWAEFFFFVLMVIGIIIAVSAPSAVISYIVIFLSGMMAGRIIYFRKTKLKTAYYIIIFGFLIGYLLGTIYGSRKVVIILFFIGTLLSYYLFDKEILRDTLF